MHPSSSTGSGNSSGTGTARGTASATPAEGEGKEQEQEKKIKVSEAKSRVPHSLGGLYAYLDWPRPHSPQVDDLFLKAVPPAPPGSPRGVEPGDVHLSGVTTTASTSSRSSTQTTTSTATATTTTTAIAVHPNNAGGTVASAALGKLLSEHHKRQGLGWHPFDAEPATVLQESPPWNPSEAELIGIIFDRDPEVLIEEESRTVCAAARQSSTLALEMLMQPERAIAFYPFERASQRGWHPEHCPFRCAVDHNRPENLALLLQHGARPGAAFEQTLQQMPAWAKGILREYGYML